MEIRAEVKKQAGSLILESKYILWKGDNGTSQTIDLSTVAGMKATPPTAASNRILLTGNDGPLLKLDFPSRDSLDSAKQSIQQAIQSVRSDASAVAPPPATPTIPLAVPGAHEAAKSGAPTAAPAPANPLKRPDPSPSAAKKAKKPKISLEPAKLLANFDLQKAALEKDKTLQKTFQQTVMTGTLTNEQFWEVRIDLLVTSAQEIGQARGAYNVLSTIKPVTSSDNRVNLSLTRDKINDIFDQYPIVRKAYNDNVPNISEGEFWQKFFMSRFFLHLRGERISNNHPWDPVLDKYIDILEESILKRKADAPPSVFVPMYLDVKGNVDDVPDLSQAPQDSTMRIGSQDSYGPSLIRQFNGLSKRLVSGIRRQPNKAVNQNTIYDLKDDAKKYDQELMNQIKLTDLEPPVVEGNSIGLQMNLKDQSGSNEASNFVASKQRLVSSLAHDLDLSVAVDSDEQRLSSVQQHVNNLIKQQANHLDDGSREDIILADREVLLCQATTLEFLRHFWAAKQRQQPLDSFINCLKKSIDRIDSVIEKSAHHAATRDALSPLLHSVNRALES